MLHTKLPSVPRWIFFPIEFSAIGFRRFKFALITSNTLSDKIILFSRQYFCFVKTFTFMDKKIEVI